MKLTLALTAAALLLAAGCGIPDTDPTPVPPDDTTPPTAAVTDEQLAVLACQNHIETQYVPEQRPVRFADSEATIDGDGVGHVQVFSQGAPYEQTARMRAYCTVDGGVAELREFENTRR